MAGLLNAHVVGGEVEFRRTGKHGGSVHILALRLFKGQRKKIPAGFAFCGRDYRDGELVDRAAFNARACGICCERYAAITVVAA